MRSDRTELEWIYTPPDFFEAGYERSVPEFHLSILSGRVLATLDEPGGPVPNPTKERVRSFVNALFHVRQLQTHAAYKLEGPRIYQYSAGRKSVAIELSGVNVSVRVGQVDVVVHNAAGEVVHDSKAERISHESGELNDLAPKVAKSPILQNMLTSYATAVEDPENELVHLYEIRDSLAQHYGGTDAARVALGISKTDWRRLGELANVEPLEQGRHRGKRVLVRRSATEAELKAARSLVHRWIFQFAQTL
jgi:hypothetical protein